MTNSIWHSSREHTHHRKRERQREAGGTGEKTDEKENNDTAGYEQRKKDSKGREYSTERRKEDWRLKREFTVGGTDRLL